MIAHVSSVASHLFWTKSLIKCCLSVLNKQIAGHWWNLPVIAAGDCPQILLAGLMRIPSLVKLNMRWNWTQWHSRVADKISSSSGAPGSSSPFVYIHVIGCLADWTVTPLDPMGSVQMSREKKRHDHGGRLTNLELINTGCA